MNNGLRTLIALVMGILLIVAGIRGNLGSMLAALIDPAGLGPVSGSATPALLPTTGNTTS